MRGMIATACVLVMMTGAVRAQQPPPSQPLPSQQPSVAQPERPREANRPALPPGAPAQAATTKPATGKHSPKPGASVAASPPAATNPVGPVPPAAPVAARSAPPLSSSLMNSAPVKPSVTMQNGLLTIDAPNSTLGDVLSAVRKATGASIEGASSAERVAVRIGPGEPNQVLDALLRGTSYDYVILGSKAKPNGVTLIVLTQSGAGSPGQNAPRPGRQSEATNEMPDEPPAESPQNDDVVPPPAAEPEAEQPPPQTQTEPPANSAEQLFRELQHTNPQAQQFQQQQIQQQQQFQQQQIQQQQFQQPPQ
jgi:hypothetical protein